jgi:predicted  nucleic acid-binding Zn-ribbon protein
MLQQIEELLNADAPALDTLETTLTDGYAQALALEAERWRLERRLGEVAREGGAALDEELSSLGRRLSVADDELSKLRSLLGTLHDRARKARRPV